MTADKQGGSAASMERPALLASLEGANHPPVALNVSSRYQFCVNAGAAAAVCFFDDLTAMGLHDHIAASMHGFLHTLQAIGTLSPASAKTASQSCTDAFAAGYLGRIQQELRLFRNECTRPTAPGTRAVH